MRASELELLDLPIEDTDEVRESIHDVERLMEMLGTGRRFSRRFRNVQSRQPKILDVGAGSGWLGRRLEKDALRQGLSPEVVYLDISPVLLECARRSGSNHGKYVLGDARELQFPAKSFDFVVCSTMLHHLSNEDARKVVVEIDRVASKSWVICDLRRRLGAPLAASIVIRLATKNRITRNDGPLSFRRAFSFHEFQQLGSDLPSVRCEKWGPACMALVKP